jgi:hypothetical protein
VDTISIENCQTCNRTCSACDFCSQTEGCVSMCVDGELCCGAGTDIWSYRCVVAQVCP